MPHKREPWNRWMRSATKGRGRGWIHEQYAAGDGRKHHDECHHTQFLDVTSPPTHGVCLDCGAHFSYATWNTHVDAPVLTDAQLDAHRSYFHEVWWGVTDRPTQPHPAVWHGP